MRRGGPCSPGDTESYGYYGCESVCAVLDGSWQWEAQPCDTPLVLAFDREHVEFIRATGAFDLSGRSASVGTDWVSARTPWLAMDLDGNGRIDDGRGLFGSMTELPDGHRAPNGFAALATLHENHDREIDGRDAAFEHLMLWRDSDQDRVSSPDELVSAGDAGLVAIRLDYASVPRCLDGDCEVERASFVYRDDSGRERDGTVIDVHFSTR